LPNYNGKCKNLHGHTYYLETTIQGKVDEKTGMIIDFFDLEKVINNKILKFLDHSYLNDLINNPTTENVAKWIWQKLEKSLKKHNVILHEIKLYENLDSSVTIKKGT
jgi:6-pyruvoyltetrahydropterin/6-carboxytetrahydropterin synthase